MLKCKDRTTSLAFIDLEPQPLLYFYRKSNFLCSIIFLQTKRAADVEQSSPLLVNSISFLAGSSSAVSHVSALFSHSFRLHSQAKYDE